MTVHTLAGLNDVACFAPMAMELLPKVVAGLVHFQFVDSGVGNVTINTNEQTAAGATGGFDASPIGSLHGEHKLSLPGRAMLRHLIFDFHLQQQFTVPDTCQASPPHSLHCWTCDDLTGANGLKPGALLAKTRDES